MDRLFGTDGIRGKANVYPVTVESAVSIGKVVAHFFKSKTSSEKKGIVIGKDTRISGDMLEAALVAGICSMGVDAYLLGVIPTPAVACLARDLSVYAGIVISASHNPFYDNGIKIFDHNGYKLTDAIESQLEDLFKSNHSDQLFSGSGFISETGRRYCVTDAQQKYVSFLKQTIDFSNGKKLQSTRSPENTLGNFTIILDCANGATSQVAPRLFKELGANVTSFFVNPDGKNINDRCGSQYPEPLMQQVTQNHADIGLAFDGDGDRLIAVDEKGSVITGDQILFICAHFARQQRCLNNNLVVTTVMSNIGLRQALKNANIGYAIANVGDRYVLEKMKERGADIGGEDSGHMIFLAHHTTGDGLLTALKLLEVMQATGKQLSELAQGMTVFPQVLLNVDVASKPDITTIPEIQAAIQSVEAKLKEKGRVLVRYSGTQPLCRVMVEGPDMAETETYCQKIADVVRDTIGA